VDRLIFSPKTVELIAAEVGRYDLVCTPEFESAYSLALEIAQGLKSSSNT